MNHLAHLRLAPDTADGRLGNLLGDFLRGVDQEAVPARLRPGVLQHRAVDALTDRHPAFRRACRRLPPPFERHAPVLVDIFFDHVLAREWSRFGDGRPLHLFTAEVYRQIVPRAVRLPGRIARVVPRMAREDWLTRYATLEGITAALHGLERRARRPRPFARSVAVLVEHDAAFTADFESLFTDLLAAAPARAPAQAP